MMSGSFHTSHASTRLSRPKAPTMPFTYASSRGYCEESRNASAPGLCTHPELCTPGRGSRCLPSCGLGSQQESNKTKSGLKIGRASCRERVEIEGGGGVVKEKRG